MAGLEGRAHSWRSGAGGCDMTLDKMTRVVYGLLGIVFVLLGAVAMLVPTGWLPQALAAALVAGEIPDPFGHILQEYGAVFLALGFVFLWYAKRNEQSRSFHWAMTLYFLLNASIHWVGPEGIVGSWSSGIVNSTPFLVMLFLGLRQRVLAQER